MRTIYFLGAGASAQDGLPVTDELNYGIANFLCSRRGRDSSLHRYYRELYGIKPPELRKASEAWQAFLDDRRKRPAGVDRLPSLIETLSILDLALLQGTSFGVSGSAKHGRELDQAALLTARMEFSMALGRAIADSTDGHPAPHAKALVQSLQRDDAIVSTNWDTLTERALTRIQREDDGKRFLQATNIRYCTVNERLVNFKGEDIKGRTKASTTVLKLHGSLNWFYCRCCASLYANVEGTWIIDPLARRSNYDECHCGAWLENLMVVPSFIKNYDNVHVRSTWHHAQRTLEQADRWVFIGYRLPSDDYHIRSLLLRALRTSIARNRNRRRKTSPEIVVVSRKTGADLKKRYTDLFRLAPTKFVDGGIPGWLQSV